LAVQIRTVTLSERAAKDLRSVPRYIQEKLLIWIDAVELRGLAEVRKVPGFHDEPLKGDRKGQRSIRLNQAYRAIYVVVSGTAQFVQVEEVIKHRY
jgi:toxin HigB-1